MNDQESSNPNEKPETWKLNDWKKHRPGKVPFDLKKDLFSVVWSSKDDGMIQFRLDGSGDHQIPFTRRGRKWGGDFQQGNARFEFRFTIIAGSPRQMQGDFYEVTETGPDPVASWGAEERGGGPILGHGGHGRGEHQPEPAAQC